jgi:cytochrome c-type biogenesis protein CcmE
MTPASATPRLVGASAVAAGLGLLVYVASTEARVEYRTVAEAEASVRQVRLAGTAVPGSIERDARALRTVFTLRDEAGGEIRVVYRGIPPDAFQDGAAVVVEGRYDTEARLFSAEKLLAKCPSKYEGKFAVK